MNQDEIKELMEKVIDGQTSPEQKLQLLKEMNEAIEKLTADLKSLKNNN